MVGLRLGILILSAVLVISGCSDVVRASYKRDEAVIAQVVNEFSSALIELDYVSAFQYTTKGYKQVYGFEDFKRRFAGAPAWIQVENKISSCSNNRCIISRTLTFWLKRDSLKSQSVDQQVWIYINGRWQLYLE